VTFTETNKLVGKYAPFAVRQLMRLPIVPSMRRMYNGEIAVGLVTLDSKAILLLETAKRIVERDA
jgi:hypothetical protein